MNKQIVIFLLIVFEVALFFVTFFLASNIYNSSEIITSDGSNENVKPLRGIVSLTFDDGLLNQYTNAYPLMQKYGYDGTIYLITNSTRFEFQELINFEQAKEMQDSGWEIGSHSLYHRSYLQMSEEEAEFDMLESKRALTNNGFVVNSFAYPYGHQNKKIIDLSKKYYDTTRHFRGGYNDLNHLDFYHIDTLWTAEGFRPSSICSSISFAQKKNLWLVLVFHGIVEQDDTGFEESVANFDKILQCVNNSNLEVMTIGQVYQKYNNKIE